MVDNRPSGALYCLCQPLALLTKGFDTNKIRATAGRAALAAGLSLKGGRGVCWPACGPEKPGSLAAKLHKRPYFVGRSGEAQARKIRCFPVRCGRDFPRAAWRSQGETLAEIYGLQISGRTPKGGGPFYRPYIFEQNKNFVQFRGEQNRRKSASGRSAADFGGSALL